MTDDLLFSPLTLPCGAVLPNRLVKAAMSERIAASAGVPSVGHLRLYEQWGQGGAGLLITGNVMVDATAIAEPGNVVLEDSSQAERFARWASCCGEGPVWMQINHPGRQVPRSLSSQPVAPSVIPMKGMMGAFAKPRALTADEIVDLVARFARTASLAKQTGFDGVQIHAAHGYLISQFLSPLTNLRDDEWGGDRDRRRRFILEVVRAIRAEVGAAFPIGVKLNSADFQRGGFDEEESMAVIEMLEAEGVDLIEISGGTYESPAMFASVESGSESTRRREAFFLEYAEKVRGRTGLPLMVTGGFRTAQGMRDALSAGATDLIGMARPFAVDPLLPRRIRDGQTDGAPPINLRIGIKKIDGFIEAAWYQAQLRRMAAGEPADPGMGRLSGVLRYLVHREMPAIKALESEAVEIAAE